MVASCTPRGVGAQLPHAVVLTLTREHYCLYLYIILLLSISVYAVSVDVLTHAVDLHKTASR